MDLKKPTVETMMSVVEDEGAKTEWYEGYYGPLGFLKLSIEEIEGAVEIKMYYEADTYPSDYHAMTFVPKLGHFIADLKERLLPDFDADDIGGPYPLYLGLRVVTKAVTLDVEEGGELTLSQSSDCNAKHTCIMCEAPLSENNPTSRCLQCDETMDSRHERLLGLNKRLIKQLKDSREQRAKLSDQLEKAQEATEKHKMAVDQWIKAHRETEDKWHKTKGMIKSLEKENEFIEEEHKTALQQINEWVSKYNNVQEQLTNSQATVRALQNNQNNARAQVFAAQREASKCEKAAHAKNSKLLTDTKTLKAKNKELKQEITGLKALLEETERQIGLKGDRIASQEERIKELECELKTLRTNYEEIERDRKELLKKEAALASMNNELNRTQNELKESNTQGEALAAQVYGLVEACKLNEQMYKEQKEKINDVSLQLIRLIAPATHIKHEIKAILKQVEGL